MSTAKLQRSQSEQALYDIERLILFARETNMVDELDVHFVRNALLDLFQFTEPFEGEIPQEKLSSAVEVLEGLLDYGYVIGLIPDESLTQRDLLDAKIMGLLMPKPSTIVKTFCKTAAAQGIKAATDQFYKLSIDSNYIRMDRIAKNPSWLHNTHYGDLQITINLSKPEKDPKEIALLKTLPSAKYPKCLLCIENVGYAGRLNHPARQNLRTIPLVLRGEEWQLQYSPYVYYNEHSIVFKSVHEPMVVSEASMSRLLDFVEQYPHYFIGSNADLPIVGGSILSHDHFQAGKHVFPMEIASVHSSFTSTQFKGITLSIVKWPMSVLRLQGTSKSEVQRLASYILDQWRAYSDPTVDILASTTDANGNVIPHNTITPIARLLDNGTFELDLVLRNNRTSDEHPDGIFHPHQHLHHIKKENIGLIEVMGLAVLPGRLKEELQLIEEILTSQHRNQAEELLAKEQKLQQHSAWIHELLEKYGCSLTSDQAAVIVQQEVGEKFSAVLQDAGVYKHDQNGQEAFKRFVDSIGFKPLS